MRWRSLFCLLLLLVLTACDLAAEVTPTRPPFEPVITYFGDLTTNTGQPIGKAAILLGPNRAVAALCTADEALWPNLNKWLKGGTFSEGRVRIGDSLEATLSADAQQLQGTYRAAADLSYGLSLRQAVTPAQIADGTREGVYTLASPLIQDLPGDWFMVMLVEDAQKPLACGFVYNNAANSNRPLSRVFVYDLWQQGLSTFYLPDFLTGEGKPTFWFGVGTMGHIDGIAISSAR
jgi:hypothetical protein